MRELSLEVLGGDGSQEQKESTVETTDGYWVASSENEEPDERWEELQLLV